MNYAPAVALQNMVREKQQQQQQQQLDDMDNGGGGNGSSVGGDYRPVELDNIDIPRLVTVVTDLGSAHNTWFQTGVDRIYVASEALETLARRRNDNVKCIGLPIRREFADMAASSRQLGHSNHDSANIKMQLGLDPHRPMVLVTSGGEGNGNLYDIVCDLHTSLALRAANRRHHHRNNKNKKMAGSAGATICVVCGRNEAVRSELEQHNWSNGPLRPRPNKSSSTSSSWLESFFSSSSSSSEHGEPQRTAEESDNQAANNNNDDDVAVHILGFVANMAEYMVAADILLSKAGPGTIAEAAAVGLPVLLTSYLPGQEAGNVEYVSQHGFGEYRTDSMDIAETVCNWLDDAELLDDMGQKARRAGNPNAARELVLDMLTLLDR
jgi:1,2-diacylglycerol 3-beta-galactosyltransferase